MKNFKCVCKADYKNTTILVNELEYDNKKYYSVSVVKNYYDIKNSKVLKSVEYTEKSFAMKTYGTLVSFIDAF